MTMIIENLLNETLTKRTNGEELRESELRRLNGIITGCKSIIAGHITPETVASEISDCNKTIDNTFYKTGERDFWSMGYEFALKQFLTYVKDMEEM